jgi:hypothetical protein
MALKFLQHTDSAQIWRLDNGIKLNFGKTMAIRFASKRNRSILLTNYVNNAV